jgi:hypothetical protein
MVVERLAFQVKYGKDLASVAKKGERSSARVAAGHPDRSHHDMFTAVWKNSGELVELEKARAHNSTRVPLPPEKEAMTQHGHRENRNVEWLADSGREPGRFAAFVPAAPVTAHRTSVLIARRRPRQRRGCAPGNVLAGGCCFSPPAVVSGDEDAGETPRATPEATPMRLSHARAREVAGRGQPPWAGQQAD